MIWSGHLRQSPDCSLALPCISIGPDSPIICTQAYRPRKKVRHDANMTAAEDSMPEPKPLAPPLQKACHLLLAAGALVFAVGLYLGFVKHANSALVFSLLGVTTLVFGVVMLVLLKPGAFELIG